MELRHLRYFMAAAEEEHFGRAADRLCVTRPAVSQIIADLESELGTPLFERLAHRVKLTAAGRSLLPQLQAVISNLNEALALAKRVGQGKTGSLNIGYGSQTLINSIFRAAVKQFRETYPDVTLSLLEMSSNEHPRALAEGRIHGGFMHFGPGRTIHNRRGDGEIAQGETLLDWIRIQTGGLGVAVPNDHRVARMKAVTLADLAQERFVLVPRSSVSPGHGPLHALCQKAGFEPQIAQEVHTTTSQLNLVSVGMGVGLVVTGRNFTYPAGVSVIPLDDVKYTTTFVFAWVKGQKDPALERMIGIIEDLAGQDEL
ncbi:MAG: LysR family transcriptional regulator [Burkholderiales bacterium]|nr:LysR family transcriptional regulator [Burkholderiales bacterium]